MAARSTVAPEARATGRVSADQRNAALLLPPFRPAAPARRSAMHATAATRDWSSTHACPLAAALEPVPETKTPGPLLPGPLETYPCTRRYVPTTCVYDRLKTDR